jgi:hypothetical protein
VSPWLQWLGSASVGALLLALVNAFVNRRKLSAEATAIITKAASGVVQRLEAENARISASNLLAEGKSDAQQIQLDKLEDEVRAQGRAIEVHAFWDQQVVETCRDQGIDIPPPPPLTIGS